MAAIEVFIRRSEDIKGLDLNLSLDSQARIKEKLYRVEQAASELVSTLSRLALGLGSAELTVGSKLKELAQPKSKPTAPSRLSLRDELMQAAAKSSRERVGNRAVMMHRFLTYAREIELHARQANVTLKPSKGDRDKDRKAALVASYLRQEWSMIFGAKPKVYRGSEFHDVADAVGKALGIPIGPGALADKRFRSHWTYLIPHDRSSKVRTQSR